MKVCFIANGTKEGLFARRVRQLCKHSQLLKDADIYYRNDKHKLFSIFLFLLAILLKRPDIVYVEAIAYSGCIAVLFAKFLLRNKVVICTGDAYAELVKQNHSSFLGFLAGIVENTMYKNSDMILTCSDNHKRYLQNHGFKNIYHLPHGVDTQIFKPVECEDLKTKLGLNGFLTVGVVGSIAWNKKYKFCYGWDVLEVIKLLPEEKIKGLIVGDGSGLCYLKEKARQYGIQDRVVFTGTVVNEIVPRYINCIDIALLTQSNNLVGQMRSPAKTSEYMACGRFIIATDVGSAEMLLKGCGSVLPYTGVRDDTYPERLALKIRTILENPEILKKGKAGIEIARREFDYRVLPKRLENLLLQVYKQNV